MTHRLLKLFSIFIIFSLVLAACKTNSTSTPGTSTTAPEVITEPTATPEPPKELNICLGQEPSTLYFYESNSQAMWNVLEAIYDGPVDIQNYASVPVILEKLPNVEDGSLVYQSVPLKAGDIVIDTDGDLVALEANVEVYPSGCTSLSCTINYDGVSEISMDRVVATFVLLPDVKWSDGEVLTAQDSVYSFRVAAHVDTPAWKYPIDQTDPADVQAFSDHLGHGIGQRCR